MDETFALQEMTGWRISYVHHSQTIVLTEPATFQETCSVIL